MVTPSFTELRPEEVLLQPRAKKAQCTALTSCQGQVCSEGDGVHVHMEMPVPNKRLQAHRAIMDNLTYPFYIHARLYLEDKFLY